MSGLRPHVIRTIGSEAVERAPPVPTRKNAGEITLSTRNDTETMMIRHTGMNERAIKGIEMTIEHMATAPAIRMELPNLTAVMGRDYRTHTSETVTTADQKAPTNVHARMVDPTALVNAPETTTELKVVTDETVMGIRIETDPYES